MFIIIIIIIIISIIIIIIIIAIKNSQIWLAINCPDFSLNKTV